MGFWGDFQASKTVGERRRDAEREIAARKKAGQKLSPVMLTGRTIATTFWGKSWCTNLERYRDFAYRLDRGRSYVRSGSVIDLQMGRGVVHASVSGSHIYKVRIDIAAVGSAHWQALSASCAGTISSLVALMQGKLDSAVMARLCEPKTGLFPTPAEIKFSCSCPDIASMCKHVAAVLYGVGARLDRAPELLFELRHVAPDELISSVGDGDLGHARSDRGLEGDDEDLAALFGVDFDVEPSAAAPTRKKAAPAAKTKRAAPAAKTKTAAPAAKTKKTAPAAKTKKAAPAAKTKKATPAAKTKKATPAKTKKAAPAKSKKATPAAKTKKAAPAAKTKTAARAA